MTDRPTSEMSNHKSKVLFDNFEKEPISNQCANCGLRDQEDLRKCRRKKKFYCTACIMNGFSDECPELSNQLLGEIP